ncbi:MAG: hypothetical protein M1836_008172 [Candelina mexicana]|nr:MAG: hypothetical protein M1836_008172 [Candelina mexicana]
MSISSPSQGGDLNNTSAARPHVAVEGDPEYRYRSLAITENEDDAKIRAKYRPFLLEKNHNVADWIEHLELATVTKMAADDLQKTNERVKVLVLYGSLRQRSYSRLTAFEAARILFRLGCDVRVYDPAGLPVKDDVQHQHPKVQELRDLSRWSDGHVWVSPEQHGALVRRGTFLLPPSPHTGKMRVQTSNKLGTAVFKNQIDWIPLSTGSVRPTQGRTLAIAQVSGGSQSFNTVNALRILGRWMRMFTIPNQSSIPKAYTQFASDDDDGGSRLVSGANRDRLVDCMEEFVKYTILMRPYFALYGDRFSEREERRMKEQAKKEVA